MSSSTITAGRILFGDAKKHNPGDQYSLSRKAEAEFSFSIAEGDDPNVIVELAMGMATARVAIMLGDKPLATAVSTVASAPSDTAKAAATGKKPPRTPPKGTVTDVSDMNEAPAAKVEEKPAETKAELEKVAEAAKPAADAMEDFSAAPAEISDEQLLKHCSHTAARVGGPIEVRKTIGEFVDPPKGAKDIPQPQRAAFIKKLDALQPVKA